MRCRENIYFSHPLGPVQRRFCSHLGMGNAEVRAATETVKKSEMLDIRYVIKILVNFFHLFSLHPPVVLECSCKLFSCYF